MDVVICHICVVIADALSWVNYSVHSGLKNITIIITCFSRRGGT